MCLIIEKKYEFNCLVEYVCIKQTFNKLQFIIVTFIFIPNYIVIFFIASLVIII